MEPGHFSMRFTSTLCLSYNLKFIHVYFLNYVSAIYPLLLIVLTWLTVHYYNLKPLVRLQNKLNYLKTRRDSKATIIDIFATFFLLSYSKLCFTSMMFFIPTTIYTAGNYTQTYVSVTQVSKIGTYSLYMSPLLLQLL